MTKVRQDAWSHEDDVLLADTVLKHIKEGSTQLKAFEEVGDILNRTAAACGFRWNAVVRDRYEGHVSDAKRERKTFQRQNAANAVKRTLGKSTDQPSPAADNGNKSEESTEDLHLEQVISYLETLRNRTEDSDRNHKRMASLEEENQQLQTTVQQWQKKHEELENEYQSLLSVINRARKMMFMDETNPESFMSSNFRMDQEGNLENISKDSM
ncbi:prespore-specific regulator [Geomicrobium halophilum]|uniref:Prespore-specific regulator n=1 Tax=Geomicrobium halophilum TaxID=549000 RepID=A0A841PY35_9BACL|nr:RsfA family transcriptional regulator [Geomicrobium halophilum]MBB6449493.1 prespore-specific regulator [Geomicrobium halophilum]